MQRQGLDLVAPQQHDDLPIKIIRFAHYLMISVENVCEWQGFEPLLFPISSESSPLMVSYTCYCLTNLFAIRASRIQLIKFSMPTFRANRCLAN
jgi:hypothetical protein